MSRVSTSDDRSRAAAGYYLVTWREPAGHGARETREREARFHVADFAPGEAKRLAGERAGEVRKLPNATGVAVRAPKRTGPTAKRDRRASTERAKSDKLAAKETTRRAAVDAAEQALTRAREWAEREARAIAQRIAENVTARKTLAKLRGEARRAEATLKRLRK